MSIDFTTDEFRFLADELRRNGDHGPTYKALLSNNYNVILAALDKAAAPTPSPQTSPATEGESELAALIADKVAKEYAGAEQGTFRAGVHRAAVMIARRIRSRQIPYYGSTVPPAAKAGEGELVHVDGVTMTPTAAANRIAELEAERDKLREALKPLGDLDWTDDNGWSENSCPNDRICDWFGPSAFRNARALSLKETAP